jgi:hypothetical protein
MFVENWGLKLPAVDDQTRDPLAEAQAERAPFNVSVNLRPWCRRRQCRPSAPITDPVLDCTRGLKLGCTHVGL